MPPPVMMAQPSAPVRVFRVTAGSTVTQEGNDVAGAIPQTPTPNAHQPRCRVANWRGELWLFQGPDTFKYTPPNWVAQSLALPALSTDGYSRHTGLHEVIVDNAPLLIGAYNGNVSTELRWIKYDGSSWTDASFGTSVGFNPTGIGQQIVYRNTLFFQAINETGIWSVDPSGPTQVLYTFGGGSTLPYALCVWNTHEFRDLTVDWFIPHVRLLNLFLLALFRKRAPILHEPSVYAPNLESRDRSSSVPNRGLMTLVHAKGKQAAGSLFSVFATVLE